MEYLQKKCRDKACLFPTKIKKCRWLLADSRQLTANSPDTLKLLVQFMLFKMYQFVSELLLIGKNS